jgi:hypothetical protein
LTAERDQLRRELDVQVRSAEAAASSAAAELTNERDQLRRELEEQSHTRWAMLDLEKQRSAKLKHELDHGRSELETFRAQREHMASELDRVIGDLDDLRDERDQLQAQLSAAQNALTAPVDRRSRAPRFDPPSGRVRDDATMPILPLPEAAPANQTEPEPSKPAPRQRESTAYSYSEVAEEQVYIPVRSPVKGGGTGGRGGR